VKVKRDAAISKQETDDKQRQLEAAENDKKSKAITNSLNSRRTKPVNMGTAELTTWLNSELGKEALAAAKSSYPQLTQMTPEQIASTPEGASAIGSVTERFPRELNYDRLDAAMRESTERRAQIIAALRQFASQDYVTRGSNELERAKIRQLPPILNEFMTLAGYRAAGDFDKNDKAALVAKIGFIENMQATRDAKKKQAATGDFAGSMDPDSVKK
jgi:hypothetical protein